MYYLKSFLIIFFTFSLVSLFAFESFPADNIRMPVWAGKFYPATQSELKQTIENLTQKAKQTAVKIPPNKELKAIILPHAGYIYSGFTAAHASFVLSEKQFNKIILLGPDHRIGFRNCAISNVKGYQTPLGFIRLHEDTKILLKNQKFKFVSIYPEI